MTAPILLWHRRDLRCADLPALAAAAAENRPVVPVFIDDQESPGLRSLGAASRWWLDGSLRALVDAYAAQGLRLILRRGPAPKVLATLAAEVGATALHVTRAYDAPSVAQEVAVQAALSAHGIAVRRFKGFLLFEPEAIRSGGGGAYKVFTPFWRACRAAPPPAAPIPAPALIPCAPPVASDALDAWGLTPTAPDWAGGLRAAWTPGEKGAQARLDAFLANGLARYCDHRDQPAADACSRLSPHLTWGEISPRQLWAAATAAATRTPGLDGAVEKFLSELGWREFSWSLLHAQPDLATRCVKPDFERFPWCDRPDWRRAWRRGRTGYPLVDAGMAELWTSGWMHNRVRMVVASFLVKHLLQDWRWGEAWFWDTLVDADPANNPASWQWVAGCGADAAPYFRIFNPQTQGEKFDPDGGYLRRWRPDLARGLAPYAPRADALVDHAAARSAALAALARLKE